jgi:hypothetical protein
MSRLAWPACPTRRLGTRHVGPSRAGWSSRKEPGGSAAACALASHTRAHAHAHASHARARTYRRARAHTYTLMHASMRNALTRAGTLCCGPLFSAFSQSSASLTVAVLGIWTLDFGINGVMVATRMLIADAAPSWQVGAASVARVQCVCARAHACACVHARAENACVCVRACVRVCLFDAVSGPPRQSHPRLPVTHDVSPARPRAGRHGERRDRARGRRRAARRVRAVRRALRLARLGLARREAGQGGGGRCSRRAEST